MPPLSFMDLFGQLEARAGDGHLSPEGLDRALNDLARVRSASDADDKSLGPPKCQVKIVGDPEIVDCKNRYFHYLGPALLVNLDKHGLVRSLEFVGVYGGKQNKNYIRDVWHYNVTSGTWKYRDLRSMQGVPAHRIKCRDSGPPSLPFYGESWQSQGDLEFHAGVESWDSEKGPDAMPDPAFLSEFKKNSETFLVNLHTGTFRRGPEYGLLQEVIENPDPILWMSQAADAITRARFPSKVPPPPCREEQLVQVAQVVFGLTAARVV